MVVWFRYNSITKPVLHISSKPSQVVIRFIPYKDEHITLHLKEGTLIKNYWDSQKPPSMWDGEVTRIARDVLQYPQWEKHGKYVFAEQPLARISNVSGYHLVGRLIDLSTFEPKRRYVKASNYEVKTPYVKFMLNLYLSTDDNPCTDLVSRARTPLGDICFDPQPCGHDNLA